MPVPRPSPERRTVARIYRAREMARARTVKENSTKDALSSFIKLTRRIHKQILNKKD
ncbi:MAG: hypothetical protein AABW59_03865 [archaeon]